MKNRTIRQSPLLPVILWMLTLAWFLLCFRLSSQTGEKTGQLSMAMARMISEVLGLPAESIPVLNTVLRTAAHLVCFFVLTVLVCGASGATFHSHKLSILWPLGFCILFAFWDEIRKADISGRHCSIPEAFLNTLGCVLGCIALYVGLWVLHRRKKD